MNIDQSTEARPAWESMTEVVIGCAFKVANALGPGFLEKVYENALAHEIRKSGLRAVQQHPIDVFYDGVVVGHFAADLVINETVLVELKVAKAIDDMHMAQCLNYLKATGKPACLLLNFGSARIGLKRILNPAAPEGWIHPADRSMMESDDHESPLQSLIRVHPHPSVVPTL